MRCVACEKLSFRMICKNCQKKYFDPVFNKRELAKDFFVYSFYEYDGIKELLNSKYEFYGDRIYNILASLSFSKFGKNFEFIEIVDAVPIDDHTRHDFSHTAILVKHLKSKFIAPKINLLKAKNQIKYAGKTLEFRKNNPRNFFYNGEKRRNIILVDDIITTGTTILEAKRCLEQNGCKVLFALTLCDAKN
jgi:competence protein ComFC